MTTCCARCSPPERSCSRSGPAGASADTFAVVPETPADTFAVIPATSPPGRAPAAEAPERGRRAAAAARGLRRAVPAGRPSSRTRICTPSGCAPAAPTGFRGRCSPRSTRSSPTSAGTWARARPARSAGCSSCPTPGCAGEWTRAATGSPTPGTPRTPSTPPRAISPRPGGRTDISRAIFAYNHAQWYVDDVLELAAVFGGGGGADVVFTLDRMSIALEDAQEQVAVAERTAQRGGVARDRADRRRRRARAAGREPRPAPLRPASSRRRTPSRPIRNAPPRAPRSSASAPSSTQCAATLETARSGAHSASFAPAAAAMLRMPTPRGRLRLPRRRRSRHRLRRPRPPRLPRCGHRRPGRRAGVRARRRRRALAHRRR